MLDDRGRRGSGCRIDHAYGATEHRRGGGGFSGRCRMNHGERHIRPDGFANPAHLGQADRRIDRVGGAPATPAEHDHGQAERSGVDRCHDSGLTEPDRLAHRRSRQVAIGPFQQVVRTTQCHHHPREALGRGARVQGARNRPDRG